MRWEMSGKNIYMVFYKNDKDVHVLCDFVWGDNHIDAKKLFAVARPAPPDTAMLVPTNWTAVPKSLGLAMMYDSTRPYYNEYSRTIFTETHFYYPDSGYDEGFSGHARPDKPDAAEVVANFSKAVAKVFPVCSCPIKELMRYGCQCGAMAKEKVKA